MVSDPIAKMLGQWSSDPGIISVIFRMAVALIFSTVIGYERSSKRHSAGLRTFILVTISATAAMLLDCFSYPAGSTPFYLIPAAVIIGVSTLCVNSLLFSSKNQIKGLTTAAALWCCAIIGLTLGAGFYTLSVAAFAILWPSLALMPKFEAYLKNRSNHFEIHLELKNSRYLLDFVTVIRKLGLTIDEIEANPAYVNSGLSVYSVALSIHNEQLQKYKTHKEIIQALESLDYVSYIEEMNG